MRTLNVVKSQSTIIYIRTKEENNCVFNVIMFSFSGADKFELVGKFTYKQIIIVMSIIIKSGL